MTVRLVFGCGYLGHRVARQWLAQGDSVFAVTRSGHRAEQFAQEGLHPILADVTRPDSLGGLPEAETVLYSVGHDRGEPARRVEVYVEGLMAVLAAIPSPPSRILHVSSTGVYAPADFGWVDEESPCHPVREAGQALLAAEGALRNHPLSHRAVILRLAGLYGPGRVPRMADLLAGRPLAVSERSLLNLIHVEDAARVVVAAEAQAVPPRTYNVSDGRPVARREFYGCLAGLLDLPPPRFVQPSAEEAASLRSGGEKRVSNARMLAELSVQLVYPSYREGLVQIVAAARK